MKHSGSTLHMMRSALAFLSRPSFALSDLSNMMGVDPRRATVWIQRAEDLHVPVGVRLSERKRLFDAFEFLQFGVLSRLLPPSMDGAKQSGAGVSIAGRLASDAVEKLAHRDELGGILTPASLTALQELGLFVRSSVGREIQPGSLRRVDKVADLQPIPVAYEAGLKLLKKGSAPETYTLVYIGSLLIRLIQELTIAEPSSAEANVFAEWLRDMEVQ